MITFLWRGWRRYWFELLMVAAGVLAAVEVIFRLDSDSGPLHGWTWLLAIYALVFALPLVARQRFPFAAPAAAFLIGALASFLNGNLVTYAFGDFVVVVSAAFLFGMLYDRTQSLAGLAIALGAASIVVHNDPDQGIGDFIWIGVFFTIAWLAGLALGSKLKETLQATERAERAERERERMATEAVAEERARIARELHDVVAHSVSVMVVQAAGVRRLLRGDQEREREALLVVERIGREALAEMRRMLGVMRTEEQGATRAPQPSLEHLDRLIERVNQAGLEVDLRVEGEPRPLPAGIDLSAYRIVQEGLTNALKHGTKAPAHVFVRYGEGELELEVVDDSPAAATMRDDGQGLAGMRERVAVYGGAFEAGPRPEGGFRVHARLPLAGAA